MAAFIDLQKAFDIVNFDILIEELKRAGIRNSISEKCKSYLLGRS